MKRGNKGGPRSQLTEAEMDKKVLKRIDNCLLGLSIGKGHLLFLTNVQKLPVIFVKSSEKVLDILFCG